MFIGTDCTSTYSREGCEDKAKGGCPDKGGSPHEYTRYANPDGNFYIIHGVPEHIKLDDSLYNIKYQYVVVLFICIMYDMNTL